ncbi:MAG: hypothetical protein ACPGOV_14255 [Magnetovibrionaceae bacterium]
MFSDNEENLQRARDRAATINSFFLNFHSGLPSAVRSATYLSKAKLLMAVMSYYIDIDRLKDFHMGESDRLVNRYKVAAYTAKWLVKLSPIQLDEDRDRQCLHHHITLVMNAAFALCVLCHFANINPNTVGHTVAKELMYNLHYRLLEADLLAQYLKVLSERNPGQNDAFSDLQE